jgi:hypothetical protein
VSASATILEYLLVDSRRAEKDWTEEISKAYHLFLGNFIGQ